MKKKISAIITPARLPYVRVVTPEAMRGRSEEPAVPSHQSVTKGARPFAAAVLPVTRRRQGEEEKVECAEEGDGGHKPVQSKRVIRCSAPAETTR